MKSDARVHCIHLTPTQAYSARDAHKYLTQPGYLELENGWAQLDDGTVFIAIRTEIPEGKPM